MLRSLPTGRTLIEISDCLMDRFDERKYIARPVRLRRVLVAENLAMGDEIPELCGGPQYIGFYGGEEPASLTGSLGDELAQSPFVEPLAFNWQAAAETRL